MQTIVIAHHAAVRHVAIVLRFSVVLLLLLLLSACTASLPTHYFILTPMTSAVVPASVLDSTKQVIAVSPVEIPLYLSRSQIVTRSGKNHLHLSQFNLWGDNLRENISRVLLENLSSLLGTDRIFLSSSLGQERPTLGISTSVSQFEAEDEAEAEAEAEDEVYGKIVLKARWRIIDSQTDKALVVRQSSLVSAPLVADDYDAIVASMSTLLMQLSQEIAQEVSPLIK